MHTSSNWSLHEAALLRANALRRAAVNAFLDDIWAAVATAVRGLLRAVRRSPSLRVEG
jgi:hypothetical protein